MKSSSVYRGRIRQLYANGQGMEAKAVAQELGISVVTVYEHTKDLRSNERKTKYKRKELKPITYGPPPRVTGVELIDWFLEQRPSCSADFSAGSGVWL